MSKKKELTISGWFSNNKYLLTLGLFVIWMLFFDRQDVFTQIRLNKSSIEVQEEKEMYIREIAETKQELSWLKSNSEKFARENYYLSKPQEDVFIFVEE